MFEILSQPASGFFGARLIQEIERSAHKHYSRLVILVAYAKQSGVLRLKPVIQKFLAAGGHIQIVVGVGQGNTSYEALKELHDLGVSLYVYHDSNLAQTFHPKLYLLIRKRKGAWVSVGSSNLTAGGHYTNYEINSIASLNFALKPHRDSFKSLASAIAQYFDTKGALSRKVSQKFLDELNKHDYVVTEAGSKLAFTAQAKKSSKIKLFGTKPLPQSLPSLGKPPASAKSKTTAQAQVQAPQLQGGGGVFWKRLSNWDVNPKSSPGQIQIPIGHLNMFPPLSNPHVTPKGATQSEVYFDVVYREQARQDVFAKNARAILYVPAPGHKRPNPELRFTFHNRGIFNRLSAGEVLVFRRTNSANIWFIAELIKQPSAAAFLKKTGTILPAGI